MTDYDRDVIEEWRKGFAKKRDVFGVQPDIWDRVQYLRDRGYRRFPHVQAVLGRRASKGLMGGVLGAEQVAYFYSLDDWQAHYGIDPGQDGYLNVFATSQSQAQRFQFADIRRTVENCKYLQSAISTSKEYYFSIRTPADVRKIAELKSAGVVVEREIATLKAIALSANSSSGRGAVSFANFFDEFAFLIQGTGSNKSDAEIYESAQPSLDQFGKDALTYIPSSPFTKSGKCYELYRQGSIPMSTYADREGILAENKIDIEADADEISADPEMLVFQGASWDLYRGWERGAELVGVRFKRPVQPDLTSEIQQRRQRRNPEKFKVERCLHPDTKVLCADFVWRRIADLSIGHRLVGLDEDPPHDGCRQRKMKTAIVTDTVESFQPAYRLTFDDGSNVVCSGTHRWLSEKAGRPGARWRSLFPRDGQRGPRTILSVGDQIRHLVDPWESDESWEAGYLAGFFDGEGTVITKCRGTAFGLGFSQLPGDTLDFVVQTLKDKGFNPTYQRSLEHLAGQWDAKNHRTRSAAQLWYVYGFDAVMRFVGSIGGVRMARDAAGFWEDRGLPRPRQHGRVYKTIVSIEELPEQRLIDIQTTTGTFVAEGLISHNCGQWAEVESAYLDPDKVDEAFVHPDWREPLEPQDFGRVNRQYRIHCDPGRVNANFAMAVAHLEDMPPDEHGDVWPCAIFDYVKVWKPSDYLDHTIDYIEVEKEIKDVLKRFPSTAKISFDQWNSASFLANIRKEFSPNIRVVEEIATERINQARCEKFKSALNLGWMKTYLDHYGEDGNCLLEQELKFLTEKNGKVMKQDFGPCTTKDLFDAVSIVTTDLLHDALDRWAMKLATGSSYGSTDVAGMRSGRELDRLGRVGGGAMDRRGSLAREMLANHHTERARSNARMDREVGFPTRGRIRDHQPKPYVPSSTRKRSF